MPPGWTGRRGILRWFTPRRTPPGTGHGEIDFVCAPFGLPAAGEYPLLAQPVPQGRRQPRLGGGIRRGGHVPQLAQQLSGYSLLHGAHHGGGLDLSGMIKRDTGHREQQYPRQANGGAYPVPLPYGTEHFICPEKPKGK